jgi:hypothetical protein
VNAAPLYAKNVSVGINAGTLGLGMELSAPFGTSNMIGRVGFNYYIRDEQDSLDNIDYTSEGALKTGLALLDWHPLANGIRVTSGLFYNGNELTIRSTSIGDVDIGDATFVLDPDYRLTGTVDFNSLAPYLGIGYGQSFKGTGQFSFSMDIGVLFQGTPEISLNAEGSLATFPGIQASLNQEEINIQREINKYQYYPVLSIGLSYRY